MIYGKNHTEGSRFGLEHLAQTIIEKHLVRKTGRQKAAFRETLKEGLRATGVEAGEESYKDLFRSVNVVVGDPETAELVFTAHYDTAPRMPLPNFITPRNWPCFLLWQLVIAVLMLVVIMAAAALVVFLTRDMLLGALTAMAASFAMVALLYKGPANPMTYNDNTSGVAALVGLIGRMPPELRSRCAFVFFDNEELGMLGSSAFRKAHARHMRETPLINMDCVGDGDLLLLAASKAFRNDERLYTALHSGFPERENNLHVKQATTIYPSDQMGFRKSLAVAAMRPCPLLGGYIGRIHTPRDTILREDNLERVIAGLAKTAEQYFRESGEK